MFGTIRKHQQWLWIVIITVIVISFVIYFSPYSKMNSTRRGPVRLGSINGEAIGEQDFNNAYREVNLRYFFMSRGQWPSDESKKMGFDPDAETYKWLLLIQKQEELGIRPGTDAVNQFANELLHNVTGEQVSPAAFQQQILAQRGLQLADLERFVRHYLGVQELDSVAGLSGKLVTPQEAKGLYERERQEMATEAVFFSASNHLSEVKVSPEAITQFYSNQLANYRIPERRQVSYVKFGVSNYLAEAQAELAKTNLNEVVENEFTRLGTNYQALAKTPEEAKAKIRDRYVRNLALVKARRKAADFAGPLFGNETPKLADLEKLAKVNNLDVKVSEPFDRDNLPKDVDAGLDFLKQAFVRTPQEPVAPSPIVGKDGVYIITLNKDIPSEVPALDKIRDKVTADYKFYEAMGLARIAGMKFSTIVTNGLAQGKTFDAISTDAKVKPVGLPPFSLSTRELPEVEDHIRVNQLKELAFSTPVGKASDFKDTQEGGLVLYVKARLPLDQAKMQAELPNFVSYVRSRRTEEAFEAWFRKEAEKGLRDTPLGRPQQQPPPTMAPGAGKS